MTDSTTPPAAPPPPPRSDLARQVRRKLAIALVTVAATWLAGVAGFAAFQDRLIYRAPAPSRVAFYRCAQLLHLAPSGGGEAGAEVVALWFPARPWAHHVVYFHGNGEQLVDTEDWAFELTRRGFGVLSVEYPGYGPAAASGPPSEAGLYAAGETALAWLREHEGVPPERTVLMGHSMGTLVAAEMARRGHGGRVVLLSPFTSMADVMGRMFPYLPVSLLVREPLDVLGKAPDVGVPALVVHGKKDQMQPPQMGRAIAAAMPQAQLILVENGGDELMDPRLVPLAECVADWVLEGFCHRRL